MRAELAFWFAVVCAAIVGIGTFKIIARGPAGELFPPARNLADLI